MLRRLYDRTLALARSRYAVPVLGGVAFTESIIFPIPPDVMLLPMMFAQRDNRQRIWGLAAWTTLCSGAGAIAAYIIGATMWEAISPLIPIAGYEEFKASYAVYGVWVVLVAAISFIPFKLATLASGALGAPLLPFILAAFIGRGIRFFILAALVYFFGRAILTTIEQYSAAVSFVILALILVSLYFIWV